MSAQLFKTPACAAVFADARLPEPKSVWNYFLALIETPRGSGFPDLPREKLLQFGKDLGLEAERDEVGNVMIRKPATPGFEARPGVCLQAHYDMVTVATEGVTIDFTKDPLVPRLVESDDKKFGDTMLMATGTSLGADNGIGCAMVLAILADKSLKHGPLEGLFTTDEETTMEGASKIKPGFIRSPYLINVDSEESWRICIGCAGGFEAEMFIPVAKTEAEGYAIRIEMKGGQGGHSGVEIDKGRANVVKALGQLINESLHHVAIPEVFLQYYVGGEKRNVIPGAARCSVVVPADKKDAFLTELHKQEAILKQIWKTIEPDLEFIETVNPELKKHVTFDAACSRRFLDAVLIVPHGVMRMSPDVPGLVETSVNVYRAFLCDMCAMTEAPIGFFARSSDNGYMPVFHRQLVALARACGARITEPQAFFPGWLPDTTNPLLAVAKQAFIDVNKKEAEIYAIHAGLECGMFQLANPHLKCISVGPYMSNVHSPQERLYVSTMPSIYALIVRILDMLDK